MKILICGARVFVDGCFVSRDLAIVGGTVAEISPRIPHDGFDRLFSFENRYVVPGFVDVHTHLREPGFSCKETISTGTRAAAHGGYTRVCSMPNLLPPPDSAANLRVQADIISRDAAVHVHPYGTITRGQKGCGELSDFDALRDDVCAFTDDGRGVQSEELMLAAMKKAASIGKIIAAHCEDNSLLHTGYIHDGRYSAAHSHRGISSASEYVQLERDLRLSEQTGCRYHVCHVSTKESVAMIRAAKARGVRVTAETAPHYLTLCEDDLLEEGRFKMNPPLRGREDRQALIDGVLDGTIDMIATDHAPHTAEEKGKGLEGSLMGIVGLETAFPVLFTALVKNGILPLEKLVSLMSTAPAAAFGFECGIKENAPADLTVLELEKKYQISSSSFLSMGKSTPFEGKDVYGRAVMTLVDGRIAWNEEG